MNAKQVEIVRESLRRFNRRAGVLKSDPYGLGLSLSQSSALVDIARFKTLRPNDLVRLLNLEKSSVSRLLSVLEKGGYLKMSDDPSDGRSKLISLTKEGQRAVTVIDRASNSTVVETFEKLSLREQSELVAAFEKLQKAVDSLNGGS